ncbi:MAG: hypothetical protein KDB01_12380 [Planctomycetaceae bacterium]|nr:hypothetical protein [Planctomycetaceae bacterium]
MSTKYSNAAAEPVRSIAHDHPFGTTGDRGHERSAAHAKEKSIERNVAADPTVRASNIIAAGSVVPLGLAVTAAVTTYLTSNEKIASTAWIAVAVVGTASVISAAVASRHRVVSVERDNQGPRAVDQSRSVPRG